MVDMEKILTEEVDRLQKHVVEMKPIYDWAIKNGISNFDIDGSGGLFAGAEPVITGKHVQRFYSMFHWNDISDDTITGDRHMVEKAESLLAKIYHSISESDDTVTVFWIRDQLVQIFGSPWIDEHEDSFKKREERGEIE